MNISKNSLMKINLGVSSAMLILALIFAGNAPLFGLDVSYLARDELSGNLLPAQRSLAELSAKSLLVLWLGIETIAAFTLLRFKGFKQAVEKSNINRAGWTAWGITGFVLLFVIGALSGVRDTSLLKLLGFLAFIGGLLGWVNDWVQAKDPKEHWLIYWLAAVSAVLPWLVLISKICLSWVFGMVNSPWYILTAIIAGTSGAATVAFYQFLDVKNKPRKKNEQNFLLIGLISKAVIALSLIIGLKG